MKIDISTKPRDGESFNTFVDRLIEETTLHASNLFILMFDDADRIKEDDLNLFAGASENFRVVLNEFSDYALVGKMMPCGPTALITALSTMEDVAIHCLQSVKRTEEEVA